jgi:peptidoglycan-associated lipoprotein
MFKGLFAIIAIVSLASLSSCAKNKSNQNTKQSEKPVENTTTQTSTSTSVKEVKLVSDRVFFDFNSFGITSKAVEIIKGNAEYIKTKKLKVVISGHCDERGSVAYNYKLGMSRAKAVRDALISYGVNSSLIKIVSKGEKAPIAKGKGEEIWQKNRVGIFTFDNFKKLSINLSKSSMVAGDVIISIA